ncbi:MAG: outer membrane beta-barrel family protein, partial [Bacteroides sp.]|nr:outer membrane beta-barrel family protein [Bacteroides sp.]
SLLVVNTWAQEIILSGKVTDAESGLPLEFSTIALTEVSSGLLISGAVCDAEGRFKITGELNGAYLISFSFVGFTPHSQEILIGELNKIFDLGVIELFPLSVHLEEVTVSDQASTLSQELDKKTFSMDDMVAQSGGSVLDAMKTMPGVTVDQEGKIILRGSDKVVVLIDGKQSSLTGFGNQKGLGNIPSANIEKIEIINNPSAKYDARGMAGIINIIYKKESEEGFNGDIGFAYGIGALSKPRADLPTELGSFDKNSKYIPSLNVNYRKEKVNFFLQSEAMFLNQLPNNEFTTRYYDDGRITASQVPENRTQQHYIVNGGIEYNFNEHNSLVVSGIYDWEKHVDTAQVPYIDMITGDRYRYLAWNEEEVTGYMNFAAAYTHKFAQPGHELDVSAQYTKGWEDETYSLNDSSSIRQGTDLTNILATEHTTNLQVDYIKALKSGRVEAGTKVQFRSLPVEYSTIPGENSIIYPGLGSWSDWGENVLALYGNYIHEKTHYDVEAGLRAEHTKVFYDIDPENIYYDQNDAYQYFELFPNIRLSYKIAKRHRLSAFYNRRIDRPGEPELRIFPKSDDAELLKVGNPYLRPQFTQSFELAYRFKWETGMVFISGYYRLIENPYMRIYSIDSTNTNYDVIVKSYANTGSANNGGFEILFSQQILKIWKLSGNANFYKNTIDSYEGSLLFPYPHNFIIETSAENTWDAKLINSFKVGKNLQVQLTAVYYAPKNIPQGEQLSRSSIDFGITQKVFKGKGEVSFSASDIFNTFGIRQEIYGDGFSAIYENYYETQIFRLGIKYRF